jgi:hypothetical protein
MNDEKMVQQVRNAASYMTTIMPLLGVNAKTEATMHKLSGQNTDELKFLVEQLEYSDRTLKPALDKFISAVNACEETIPQIDAELQKGSKHPLLFTKGLYRAVRARLFDVTAAATESTLLDRIKYCASNFIDAYGYKISELEAMRAFHKTRRIASLPVLIKGGKRRRVRTKR